VPPDVPPLDVAVELRPGLVLGGKYLLLRRLGVGGMGVVWIARNAATGADVAVKVLLPERAVSKDALERFRREAHATARLTHRGIVRVFDLLELDPNEGSLLMVMELLRGHTLAERLHHEPRLGVDEALDVILPILSALDHAHGVGVVHRDLKPENIFIALDPDGQAMPKLLDFGISKMRQPMIDAITADGELVGTPCYMSPEQARGRPVDARSDVFSIGILLYEMLSGHNPFLSEGLDSLHAVVMAILEKEPPPIIDIPPALWAVLAKAFRKRRDERYASALELATALRDAVPTYAARYDTPARSRTSSVPSGVTQQTAHAPLTTRDRRMRAAIALSATAALLLCGSILGSSRTTSARTSASGNAHATSVVRATKVIARDGLTLLASRATSAPMEPAIVAAPPVPTAPVTAAAASLVPTATATPQPHARRRVLLVRDPGF
jgi:serine/threonine protein kinase